MIINTGLVGRGQWGIKVKKILEKISNLKFVKGRNFNPEFLLKNKNINWVFVITSSKSHYTIVRKCLIHNKNVFCEKPLTSSFIKSKKLIELAKDKNVKLFVSDIYSFHPRKIKKLLNLNRFYRSKLTKKNDFEFVERFLYHDLSIIYEKIKKLKIKKINIYKNKIKKIIKLELIFTNFKTIQFVYNLKSKRKKHIINNINFITKKDILKKMIINVLFKKNNYKKIYQKTIFLNKILDKIKAN